MLLTSIICNINIMSTTKGCKITSITVYRILLIFNLLKFLLVCNWKYKSSWISIVIIIIRIRDTSISSKHSVVFWFNQMKSSTLPTQLLVEYISSKSISCTSKQELEFKVFISKPILKQSLLLLGYSKSLDRNLVKS